MGHLLRPVASQRFEEVLTDTGAEMNGTRPDASRTGCARCADRFRELLGSVGETGKDRRDPNADVDPVLREPADRVRSAPDRSVANWSRITFNPHNKGRFSCQLPLR